MHSDIRKPPPNVAEAPYAAAAEICRQIRAVGQKVKLGVRRAAVDGRAAVIRVRPNFLETGHGIRLGFSVAL